MSQSHPATRPGRTNRLGPARRTLKSHLLKRPTQPQVVRSVTLEGEAMSKDKASKLKCNVSLKRIPASDGSYVFKSDGDKGEFGDEDEEEEG